LNRDWIDSLGLGLIAFLGAALVGLIGRIAIPVIHDEFAYILMGQTFALGRLTNPTPPFWEHLETFHVLMTPSYMGKYPPAQGLFLALGIRLGHPIIGVWLSSAVMVGAVTWMLRAWMSRKWALLGGALLLLNLGIGHWWSQSYWGGCVAAAGGAILFGAVKRGWESPRGVHGFLMGLGLLVLANSRPFEGLMLALPVLGALVFFTWDRRISLKQKAPLLVGVSLALLMGAGAMASYHRAVTGDPLVMPYREYQEQYTYAPNLLISHFPESVPIYRHPEFRDFWLGWELDRFQARTRMKGFLVTRALGLLSLLAILGPSALGLLFLRPGIRQPLMKLALLSASLALGGCLLTRESFSHYLAPAVGPLMLLAMVGWQHGVELRRPWLNGRKLFLVLISVTPILSGVYCAGFTTDQTNWSQRRRGEVSECLAGFPFRSLVLVEYDGVFDHWADWVRNGPDPFKSKVVWARSMGPEKDAVLVNGNPDRAVWRVRSDSTDRGAAGRSVHFLRFPEGSSQTGSQREPSCR
jgi:hypothetical protein